MISFEARATSIEQNPTGLASTDHWERPDAVVSTAKQDAHDSFFLDTPDGEWLPAGRIAHEVHRSAHAFVGETPLGRQVFLVAPGERTRPRNKNKISLTAHFAYASALETEYLRAVQNAEDQHLITHEEAVRQAGNMDSGVARVLRKPFRNQNQDVIHDGALIAAQATHIAIPAGIVGAGITLAARRKDEYGRRFRNVGKVMYMTSSGVTVGSLVLSACTSLQALPTQEVRVTSMPEQFNPTVDQATKAVASWVGMHVPLAEGEFGVFPTQAIFEVDQTDSTGQKLKTLSLLNPDGRTTDPDLRYAMGLALVPSEKTGEIVDLPFLVQLGKNGEALMLGMFLDQAQSTEEVGVFRLNIVKDGQIRPVTQEMVVTKVAGGVTIVLRDISDPKNIVTYHLVSTPKDVSLPPQQSAVPSQVPDNNWIDKVVAFMSGAGSVQAAEPATPVELASAIPLPSETPEPSATPTPAELVIGCREGQQAKQILDAFRTTHDVSQLLTGVDPSPTWIFSNIGPGQDRPSWETFNYNGLLVGEYRVDLVGKDVAGYTPKANSYAMCYVFVTPDAPNTPRVAVGSLVVEGNKKTQLEINSKLAAADDFESFMHANIGKVMRFDILVGLENFGKQGASGNPPFDFPDSDWAEYFVSRYINYIKDTLDPAVAEAIPLHVLVGRIEDDGFGLLLRQVREK